MNLLQPRYRRKRLVVLNWLLSCAGILIGGTSLAVAGELRLSWDPVPDSRVARYEVHYGVSKGRYDAKVVTAATSASVSGLPPGATYYFAARACDATPANCSGFSNELVARIPTSDAGQLQPTLSTPTGTANLTAEGLADWVHWGKDSAGSLNRKKGVAGQIGALTTLGGGATRFDGAVRLSYGWSDGAPTLSATTRAGLYIAGLNKGFELRVPADTSERTLVLYLGGWQARGRIEVGLSDGSAPDFVQTVEDLAGPFDRRLALSYRAASAGQTLLVRYTQTTTSGNITVQAATLQTTADADDGQLEPTLSTPTGTANLTAEGLADWVHWGKDSAGSLNRKKGVAGQIGALTTLGGNASRFDGAARLRYGWSDGAPTPSATTQAGLYIAGLNKGFELRVPADTSERTLVLYLGGWQARGRIEVGLSDGSAPDFVQTVEDLAGPFDRRLALSYRAASAGQTLLVRYTQTTTSGNITVQAATLQATMGMLGASAQPALDAPLETRSLEGYAPLTVTFDDQTPGSVAERRWDFGDGTGSRASTAVKTYREPGQYAVTLWIRGPEGEGAIVRTDLIRVKSPPPLGSAPARKVAEGTDAGVASGGAGPALELGELQVDHQWQRVSFSTPFTDPIVVAGPLGYNGSDPAVVRVKGVDSTGFWIRVQEWDYLDGTHTTETLSYLVMERGRHQLPDGAWVEAGRLVTDATNGFVAQSFSEPLYETPMVFATVTSVNEADAVTTRLRRVSVKGFEVGMQEQESKAQKHVPESIDYIAFEPSFGEVNGTRYEVGLMPSGVTDKPQTLLYQGVYEQAPLFLADMQTTNDTNTADLRWRGRDEVSLEVWVEEEQSREPETAHTAESVGYLLFGKDR